MIQYPAFDTPKQEMDMLISVILAGVKMCLGRNWETMVLCKPDAWQEALNVKLMLHGLICKNWRYN